MFKIRRYDLLVALYIFGVICAELMGSKTFSLIHVGGFRVNSSVAIFVMPLLFMLPDVVVEVYGKARARSIVFSGFVMITLLVCFSFLSTHLQPTPRFASSEAAYDKVVGYSIRLAIASLSAFASSELLDILVFGSLRRALQNRALWLRNIAANVISQFADSAVFLTLAFYSLGHGVGSNFIFLSSLLLPYWLLRSSLSIIGTPLVYAGVQWLRSDPERAATLAHDPTL